ncbi:OmpA family protein [Rubrivirga sp.]|uniref:OmpA family protein n=1 Tax=Rubrivirga sp. TaxID=1885344 RepID=UPI003B52421B
MTGRLLALALAACVAAGCGGAEAPEPEAGPSPEGTGALGPSTVTSSSLDESEGERIAQVISDLGATRTDDGQIRITLPESVLFDFDEADIRPDARATLEDVATVLDHHADAPVTIEGHTDNKGTPAYNRDLSERRASAVADELASAFGVDRGRMTTRGLGESQPVAENESADGSDNPEGRQQNRRVEVIVDAREVTDSEAAPDVVDPSGG